MRNESLFIEDTEIKPFLRWAGGKNWLIKYLKELVSQRRYNNYYEPFLGGGSIFFNLKPRRAFLSDLNEDLIFTYNVLKTSPEQVIKDLKNFSNSKEDYYRIRESNYRKASKIAARFIYLNQTSFNGIYRVNLNGEYNVPYGYRTKNPLDEENLRISSQLLSNANIRCIDFEMISTEVRKGDLVFLDPPYTVSHNHNGFIKYNQRLFSLDDQYRLFDLICKIKSKGGYYILTNAAHAKVRKIFTQEGDQRILMSRPSLIGGINAKRGTVSEYIFTNI